ncbi:MAG: fucose isomerase [Provencibacterium sp.]|jgi:L-fucose mutarotase|nr:fucose isomerase [Provencibacterium sp.]
MLYHIPKIFTPDLLRLMMDLGHGEELLICDANFPRRTMEKETVWITNSPVEALVREILCFFPLDATVDCPIAVMEGAAQNGMLDRFQALAPDKGIERVERFAFYERAKRCAGIVATTDGTRCANIILKKGVVTDGDGNR